MLVADITHQEPGFMPGRFEGLARWDVLKLLGNGIWLNALQSRRVPSSFLVVSLVQCGARRDLCQMDLRPRPQACWPSNLLRLLQEEGSSRAPVCSRASHHGTAIHNIGHVEISCLAIWWRNAAPCRARTGDLLVTGQMLCHSAKEAD